MKHIMNEEYINDWIENNRKIGNTVDPLIGEIQGSYNCANQIVKKYYKQHYNYSYNHWISDLQAARDGINKLNDSLNTVIANFKAYDNEMGLFFLEEQQEFVHFGRLLDAYTQVIGVNGANIGSPSFQGNFNQVRAGHVGNVKTIKKHYMDKAQQEISETMKWLMLAGKEMDNDAIQAIMKKHLDSVLSEEAYAYFLLTIMLNKKIKRPFTDDELLKMYTSYKSYDNSISFEDFKNMKKGDLIWTTELEEMQKRGEIPNVAGIDLTNVAAKLMIENAYVNGGFSLFNRDLSLRGKGKISDIKQNNLDGLVDKKALENLLGAKFGINLSLLQMNFSPSDGPINFNVDIDVLYGD
ncbi:MAG: hypothetical protein ACRC6X_00080, partial [Culicoidibacterales bacterium]